MNYIPIQDLDSGILLCDMNAKNLLKTAEFLFKKGDFGYSVGLAVISLEEYAKKIILLAKKNYPSMFENEVRDAFRNHNLKLEPALQLLMGGYPDSPPEDEIPRMAQYLGNKLVSLRLRGLYVDFYNGKWISPQDEELKNMAEMQIQYNVDFFNKFDKWINEMF